MTRRWCGTLALVAMLAPGLAHPARGETITVSFDEKQLVNNDPMLQFYDGGKTFRGIGPGPNYGVTFTINARVFTSTSSLAGTFTKPGVMLLYSDTAREGEGISATMNVKPGFSSSLAFDYAAIDAAGDLKFYSGADGTGTLLKDAMLPVTSPQTGPGTFVADAVNFSGVAHSVVFTGGNKQLGFDDLTFATVPEPSAWHLLASGGLLYSLAHLARRMRDRRRRCPSA